MRLRRPFGTALALGAGALLLAVALAAEMGPGPVTRSSTFITKDGAFELRVKIAQVDTGRYGYPSTRCDYSVYRNGSFLQPSTLDGGTTIGCEYIGPDEVRVEPIGRGAETVGWMLGVGGICGNTFSWKWTVIRPFHDFRRWEYETDTFLAKEEPVVRPQADRFELWTQYQEWDHMGTAASFFVPELRTVSREAEEDNGIRRAALPADLNAWPELAYPSMLGIFLAGASQLNPAVMLAAARGCTDEDREFFAIHGLPTERKEIAALTARVHEARDLKDSFSSCELHWNEDYR